LLTARTPIDVSIGRHYSLMNACQLRGRTMDTVLIVILLLVLLGGGGGLYWGMGAGWGIGPIGLILAVVVVALLLNGRRGRSL
jgi:hypothetical protein